MPPEARTRPSCPRARVLRCLTSSIAGAVLLLPVAAQARTCLVGTTAEQETDTVELRDAMADVDTACPCASYAAGERRSYETCLRTVVDARVRAAALRRECGVIARRIGRAAVCGSAVADPLPCIRRRGEHLSCKITARSRCVVTTLGPSSVSLVPCPTFARCLEAADTDGDLRIARPGDSGQCAGPRCGNGVVETAEQCDDGNTVPFDGCSASCQTETDCNPDGTYLLTSPIEYVCSTVGPGEPPFQYTIDHIAFADHGRMVDVLSTPGALPPGHPLSCAGSPVDRTDATFSLFECFFVARVVASFSDPDTLTGSITLSHQPPSGAACTPNASFSCPPVTYPMTAVR